LTPPTFNVYKAGLSPRLGHNHAPSTRFTPSISLYAHKIDTFRSYNPCIERHSRTVILCPQNTENIHQINNERKPSRASSFVIFPPNRSHKTDLNDLCQTFVGSTPNERRESLWQISGIILTLAGVRNCSACSPLV